MSHDWRIASDPDNGETYGELCSCAIRGDHQSPDPSLRRAAETLRKNAWADAADMALADLFEELWGWREEGLGMIPDGNLGDAWLAIESCVKKVARLINSGIDREPRGTGGGAP